MVINKLLVRFPFNSTMNMCRSYISKVVATESERHFATYRSMLNDRQKNYCFFLLYRHMAGHAKWQNVKNVKSEKDRQKALMCNRYVRLVKIAIREKGPDPKGNVKLANILESARKDNVPAATLENAMKRGSSNKKTHTGTVEMLGPGGCIIVLDYETDNVSEMRHGIKTLCRKYTIGLFPGGGGRWRSAYEQKGIVRIADQQNSELLNSDKMLDAAIEAGAEDVQKIEEEGKIVYEFYCAPDDLNIVKKELENKFELEEAYLGFLPIATVALSEDDKAIALNFLNELGELPDVSRLYENIE